MEDGQKNKKMFIGVWEVLSADMQAHFQPNLGQILNFKIEIYLFLHWVSQKPSAFDSLFYQCKAKQTWVNNLTGDLYSTM